ncbi:MED13L [Cordylochernes scorpioides]|uniref:Mediator of RNA polymerase II transcription subunit 13 n=1 Tax=Cordylochernes scorpioides TaxID=51811 RepID=A0ABY6JXH8_9ARAC|nr:MED13L [Cordylochernes scorpioides]
MCRGLLARGFSRLGKWFVQPYDSSDKNAQGYVVLTSQPYIFTHSRPQYTFSFNFFVYGDSTVCASVDVRQHPSIYRLSKGHLTAALESHAGLKVLLSPYGLCGTLTGHTSKETDRHGQEEWYQFYPQPSQQDGTTGGHEELLPAVEVIVGE